MNGPAAGKPTPNDFKDSHSPRKPWRDEKRSRGTGIGLSDSQGLKYVCQHSKSPPDARHLVGELAVKSLRSVQFVSGSTSLHLRQKITEKM